MFYEGYSHDFGLLDLLRRRMDRVFEDVQGPPAFDALFGSLADEAGRPVLRGRATSLSLRETNEALELTAELPGLTAEGVKVTIHQDVLTLSGERKDDAPQGYLAHRRERSPISFSRSFTLPAKVDAEKTTATMKDGVLKLVIAKAVEDKPRQIAVLGR